MGSHKYDKLTELEERLAAREVLQDGVILQMKELQERLVRAEQLLNQCANHISYSRIGTSVIHKTWRKWLDWMHEKGYMK